MQDDTPDSDHDERIQSATPSSKEKDEANTIENDEFLRFSQQMQSLERGEGYVEIFHKQ